MWVDAARRKDGVNRFLPARARHAPRACLVTVAGTAGGSVGHQSRSIATQVTGWSLRAFREGKMRESRSLAMAMAFGWSTTERG